MFILHHPSPNRCLLMEAGWYFWCFAFSGAQTAVTCVSDVPQENSTPAFSSRCKTSETLKGLRFKIKLQNSEHHQIIQSFSLTDIMEVRTTLCRQPTYPKNKVKKPSRCLSAQEVDRGNISLLLAKYSFNFFIFASPTFVISPLLDSRGLFFFRRIL